MSDLLDFSPPGQVTFSLAGAKARFYDAGTTNLRTVYADEAETIPHPSPLLADGSGRFAQVFVSGGAVKVVVTQADDSTGYTLDPCVKVSATGSAAAAVSFTPSVAIPQTNVQSAVEAVQDQAASGIANAPDATKAELAAETVALGALSRGAPVTKTADFTVGAAENWLINNKSGSTCVVTLPAAASFTGREIMIQNLQEQDVNSNSSNVIPMNGGAAGNLILPAVIGTYAVLVSDGANWRVVQRSLSPLFRSGAVPASGVALDFGNIPAWANWVEVSFDQVSISVSADFLIQAIVAGAPVTTGYGGPALNAATASSSNTITTSTSGFPLLSQGAAVTNTGRVRMHRHGRSNVWIADGTHVRSDSTSHVLHGRIGLAGSLEGVRFTVTSGVLDAGTVAVTYGV